MKLILNIILIILIVLAIGDLSMWLIAYGSGHKIPSRTNETFIIIFFILLLLISITVWLKRLSEKENKKNLIQSQHEV